MREDHEDGDVMRVRGALDVGDLAYIYGFEGRQYIPDTRVREDDSTYVYRPCRGYAASVAVEGIDGRIIGWMTADDLPGGPYRDVRQWMQAVKHPGL